MYLVSVDVGDLTLVTSSDLARGLQVVVFQVVPQVIPVGVDVAAVRAHSWVALFQTNLGSERERLLCLKGLTVDVVHEVTDGFF